MPVNQMKPYQEHKSIPAARLDAMKAWLGQLIEKSAQLQKQSKTIPMVYYRLMGQIEIARILYTWIDMEASHTVVPLTDMGINLADLIIPHLQNLILMGKALSSSYGDFQQLGDSDEE